MKRNELFESSPMPQAVMKLSLPTIIGMLVMVIYNMADTFFVGMTNDVNQVASVTVTMPVFMLLMSLGTIFGVGGASSISRYLGSKEMEKAKRTSAISFYGSIFLSLVYMVIGFIFMDKILGVAGVTENTYEFSKSYLMVLTLGAPFVVLNFAMGQIARAEGLAKEAMVGMVLGTVLNIVLDPILIMWFKMGVVGASIATVLANVVSVLYYIKLISGKKSCLSIALKDLKFDKEIIKGILFIGAPASLNNLLMSLSSILLNNFAVFYGDVVVASLGIVNRIMLLPIMVTIGLCQGIQPLIGYNYASKNINRMKEAMKFVSVLGTIMGIGFTIFLLVFGEKMVGMFINDSETVKIGSDFIKIIIISAPFLAVQFVLSSTFQAMGKAVPSLILSISRQGLIFMPVLFIANTVLGLNGIVLAQPVADIITVVIAIVLFTVIYNKELKHEIEEDNIETLDGVI